MLDSSLNIYHRKRKHPRPIWRIKSAPINFLAPGGGFPVPGSFQQMTLVGAVFPSGNKTLVFDQNPPLYSRTVTPWKTMKYSPKQIGELVRSVRKQLGATQKDLAMTSGTGLRFIIELEQGKPTSQIGKVLTVLNTLGVKMNFTPPVVTTKDAGAEPGKGK